MRNLPPLSFNDHDQVVSISGPVVDVRGTMSSFNPLRSTRKLQIRYGAILAIAALSASFHTAPKRSIRYDSPLATSSGLTVAAIETRRKQAEQHPSDHKRGDAGLLSQHRVAEELDKNSSAFDDEDSLAWADFSRNFQSAWGSFRGIEWAKVGDSITDFIVPGWAKQLRGLVEKLDLELSMGTGSLADEIWEEAHDADINPEIMWDARVRVGNDLCKEEQNFIRRRKTHVVGALARYLDISEKDIDPEDVPTIAICGSGGGLRAMVAGTGSYLSATEAGLFDCATYTAGVSGSCWLQSLFHSSIGKQDTETLANHLKNRLGIHIAFPPPALNLITSAPTNKFLLSGFVEKLKGDPGADFGLVDIYGLLLAARLLVPKGELGVSDHDLKLSNQRAYVDSGKNPLPIYTAVRHEIPVVEIDDEEASTATLKERAKEKAKREAWFQWFEFTPYEFFSEELSAGIPTWALGRSFHNGKNVLLQSGIGLPEFRLPLLFGIWGSAFCATLAHYYKEIRPALAGIAGFGGLDDLIEEKNDDLIKVHPFDPATIPNYVLGMKEQLPATCPESVFKSDHLQLMDAGMSNNLPIYPLLRPGREIDVLVAFDASADIQEGNWLSVVDGYARQRGIKGWPLGSGWPKASSSVESRIEDLDNAKAKSPQEAETKVTEAQEESQKHKANDPDDDGLGYCTVWVGSTSERTFTDEPPPSKRLHPTADFQLTAPDAGIAVIYFPFVANPKVPGVDPATSDFMSTWNFIYTPDDVESVIRLARANFEEGKEMTRRTIRAVYERKRQARLQREALAREEGWRGRLEEGGDHFR